MKQGRKSLAYANTHTSFINRYPVPFPHTYGGKLRNKYHTVYVVKYLDRQSHSHIWKYGMTSLPHYQTRANVGRKLCEALTPSTSNGTFNAKPGSCYYTWVGVTTNTNGWRKGRYLEASMILYYSRKGPGHIARGVWTCPPGQAKSCR